MTSRASRRTIPAFSHVAEYEDMGPLDSDEHAQLKMDEFEWSSTGQYRIVASGVSDAEPNQVQEWTKTNPPVARPSLVSYGIHKEATFALPSKSPMHSHVQLRQAWGARSVNVVADHLSESWRFINAPDSDLARLILGFSVALGVLFFGVIALFLVTG
jgi:hypothetical protein